MPIKRMLIQNYQDAKLHICNMVLNNLNMYLQANNIYLKYIFRKLFKLLYIL